MPLPWATATLPAMRTRTWATFPIEDTTFQLAPWSVRGERMVDGPGALDVSLALSAPVCGALLDLPTYRPPRRVRPRYAPPAAELSCRRWAGQ